MNLGDLWRRWFPPRITEAEMQEAERNAAELQRRGEKVTRKLEAVSAEAERLGWDKMAMLAHEMRNVSFRRRIRRRETDGTAGA